MNENEEMPNSTQEQQKKKKLFIIFIVLVMAAIFAVSIGAAFKNREPEDEFYDPSAMTGILPGMTQSEIQEQLNRVVEEGMLNISIATNIYFSTGDEKGKADIVNIENNHYDFIVSITLDDSGGVIYESGGIKPGQYIQHISLEQPLEDGVYQATATFNAYTEEHRLVGSAAAKVNITVGEVSE